MSNNAVEIVIKAKNLASEAMQKVWRSTKNLASGVKKLGRLAAETAKKVAALTTKVGALGAAGVALAGAFVLKKTIGQFANFEKELANVSTLVDTSVVSMDDFKKGIMALPSALGGAAELTKGLYQTISAGVEPAKALKFLESSAKAAKAGLTDTFTAVDAGSTIMNAFGMATEDADKIYDLMFNTVKQGKTTFEELASSVGKISPIASAAGVSVEEMHAAIATLTKGGFATSEASSRMATALGAIVKPSSEASKMAEELGLNFNASALAADGLQGFLQQVKSATGGNIEQMAQLFGGMESLSVMLALTGKQSQEFTTILGTMRNSAGTVDEAFNKQKITLSALWETFKNTIGKQAILIGEKLAPAIKRVIEKTEAWLVKNRALVTKELGDWINKIVEFIKTLKPAYDDIIKKIGKWYEANKDLMKVKVGDFLAGIGKAIVSIADNINLITAPIRGLIFLFRQVSSAVAWCTKKIIDLVRWVSKLSATKAILSFVGIGSPELPLSEKIAAIKQQVTGLSAHVSGQAAKYTIDAGGASQAVTAMNNANQAGSGALAGQTTNYSTAKTVGDIVVNLPPGAAASTGNDWREIVRNYIIPELQAAGAI